MGSEKRDSRRLAMNLDAMFRHLKEKRGFTVGVVDISFTGICIVVPKPISPGEHLEVKISLETGELVFLTAEVRWLSNHIDGKSFRVGLKFIEGRDGDLAKFERYYNLRVLYPPLER